MDMKKILSKLFPRDFVLFIKYIYQWLYRIIQNKSIISTTLPIHFIKKKHTHVFFGYYDVSPFNRNTDEIIYTNLVEKENMMQIMRNSVSGDHEQKIADTRAWNWQQGCRLRWMPNNDREVFFNDFDGKNYFGRIVNVDTIAEKKIIAPLYDISSDGKYGLSIDFERLGVKRPGYGYVCRQYDECEHDLCSEGIELVDIENNSKELILSFLDIQGIDGCNTGPLRNNYLNHLCFSPSGRQFLFFWLTEDCSWHKAFLLVHNLDTNVTKLLENTEKVSHYVWLDDDNIICTAVDNNKLWHYYQYNITKGTKVLLNPNVLNLDGHPSLYNQNILLTDTYPNIMGFQRLYFADFRKHQDGINLMEIYSNCCIEGEKRTDLHPRFNEKRSLVCFDCNVGKYRQLGIMKL